MKYQLVRYSSLTRTLPSLCPCYGCCIDLKLSRYYTRHSFFSFFSKLTANGCQNSVGEFFGPKDEELQPFLQGAGPPLPTYFICADEALRRPTLVRRLMCECLRVIILHVSFTKKLQYPRPFRVPAFEVIRNLFRESTYHVSPTRKTYPDNPTYGGLMA